MIWEIKTNDEQVVLIEPSSDYQLEFLDMVLENQNAGVNYGHQKTAQEDFAVYLRKTRNSARGVDLPEGHVPLTTFWLVRDDRVILGESHLRHYLTPALEVQGGHIGYNIRPSQRRKGFGLSYHETQVSLNSTDDFRLSRI